MAGIPADLGAALDPNLPVALLPIRLETRFGTRTHAADDGSPLDIPVLRIRIYPDDISVVSSPPGLTALEREAGRQFWATHDAPPSDNEQADAGALAHRRTAAWELLVRHVGRERVAFVARGTRPDADGNAPAAAVDATGTAATARLLPDSWAVVGWSGGSRVLSAHVPGVRETVQVGPSRTADADAFDPTDPHLLPADGLRWVTDFDEAERHAMAVTVDLATPEQVAAGEQPAVARDGLDTLVVFGVREPNAGRTPTSEASALTDLLSAHAARDRVAFVAQGTPTNNVDGRASGWTSAPDIFAAYPRVVGVDGAAAAPATGIDALRGGADNATTAAAALGVPSDALAGFDGAAALEQWPARAMARALFPVTIGEVLGSLARPPDAAVDEQEHLLDRLDDLIPFASEHLASFVRSRGPLPALRVGRQPYGLLPVLPAGRWARRAGEPVELAELVSLLGVLRPFWEHAAGGVGHLTGTSFDLSHATEQLVRILGLGPVPHPGAYQVHDVTGAVGTKLYCPARSPFLVEGVTPQQVFTVDRVRDVLSDDVLRLGYRALMALTLPGVHGTHFEAMQLQGIKPLRVHVARSDPDRAGWATVPDYLHRLTQAFDLQRMRVVLDPGAEHKPTDLLFVLAEHAMALSGELDSLLLLRHVSRNAATTVARISPELLASGLSVAANAAAMLTTPLAEVQVAAEPPGEFTAVGPELAGSSVFDVIADDDLVRRARDDYAIPETHLEGFPGTRAAIHALADAALSDGEYTRLVGEALSCCTNRLDAWYTSIAAQRLAALRAEQPSGLQLGSWGLLVDVRPGTVAAADVPTGWDPEAAAATGALLAPRRQIGYLHAPSLAHARTAGMLRAGELAYEGDGTTLASLDLTSRRARIARDIVAAVANGQPLGAVLGYRLERSLGDAGLHDAVSTLRAAFPQRRSAQDADAHTAAGVAVSDAVVPPEVLDGLDVWRGAATARAMCTVDDGPDTDRLAAAFADLDVAVEAVADVLVAEGVHQLASGRADAAGATFGAIASGGHLDGELDVLREPRSGTAVTNRLVLLLDGSGGADGWDRDRPRAVLAPEIERWAETVLGPPSTWRAKVGGRVVSLADVGGLCALDVVVESASTGTSAATALEQRLAAAAGVATARRVREADRDRPVWAELLALAGAVRDVLATARPVVPADLDPGPQEERPDAGVVRGPAGPTLTALEGVARRVADVLDALAGGVQAVADATAATPVPPLLAPFAALGLAGSVVAAPVPSDAVAAAAAATAILTDADRMIDGTVAELVRARVVEPPAATRLARLRAMCRAPRALDLLVDLTRRAAGSAVVPVPEVASALAGHRLLRDDARAPSDAEIEQWLGRVARVRTGTAHYDDLRLFVEARGGDPDPLTVAQLPLESGEAWLGGALAVHDAPRNPLREWRRPRGPRAHLVLAGEPSLAGGSTARGVVLDEYAEVLPAPTATTGLALHYDAPNARPPQSVLLALHPDPSQPWAWELIEATVLETLALARMRLVELDDLASTAVDEFVPLTYLRDGVGDTTPVAELTRGFDWSDVMVSASRVSEVFQR